MNRRDIVKKVQFYLGIGYPGADHKEIVEFEDNVTDEEIDEYLNEWASNYIDYGWNILDD